MKYAQGSFLIALCYDKTSIDLTHILKCYPTGIVIGAIMRLP